MSRRVRSSVRPNRQERCGQPAVSCLLQCLHRIGAPGPFHVVDQVPFDEFRRPPDRCRLDKHPRPTVRFRAAPSPRRAFLPPGGSALSRPDRVGRHRLDCPRPARRTVGGPSERETCSAVLRSRPDAATRGATGPGRCRTAPGGSSPSARLQPGHPAVPGPIRSSSVG